MVAAGAAFFGLLALFPTLAAAVALYGLVTGPETVGAHIGQLEGFAPEEARMLLTDQLQRMTAASDRSLGVGALVALLLALWSSAKGVKSLMTALDIVYHERESRGFFKLNATALLLTLAMLVVVPLSLAAVAVLPAVADRLPVPDFVATAARWLRWPLLAALSVGAIALLYRFGPVRRPAPADAAVAGRSGRDGTVADRFGPVVLVRLELRQLRRDVRVGRGTGRRHDVVLAVRVRRVDRRRG